MNSTDRLITDADVIFGDFHSGGGSLDPGIYKGHGDPPRYIPELATVQWRTADGVLHRKEVAVRSVVPRGFKGDIYFVIQPDNSVLVSVGRPREK